jgi:exonuclease III
MKSKTRIPLLLRGPFLRSITRFLILALLVGQPWFLYAEDRRTDKSVLVLMSLNGEFLWDGVPPEEGQADFPWKNSQTEAEDHMHNVAEVIIRSNPDIVNLVEVENMGALTTFNNEFLAGRGYQPYLVNGSDTFTGQDVALLTRIDPENNQISRDDRKGQSGSVLKSVSKNYIARFSLPEAKFAIVGVHFLAFPLREDRRLDREAQADAIRSIARELKSQGWSPLILGDLNDYDGDPSSRDHIDSIPITNVLKIIKEMDPNDPLDDLKNAASFVPKASRYTAFHDANQNGNVDFPNELTSIDHVLLSPELVAKVELVDIRHDHDPRNITDHFPVVVRIKLAGATGPAQVRITSILPNPAGDDTQNEEVTVKNFGSQPVNVTGWKLRDLANTVWMMDALGTLNSGEEKTIKRNGQPMALNNTGDTIDLIDPSATVIHTVTYPKVQEGEVVTPAN